MLQNNIRVKCFTKPGATIYCITGRFVADLPISDSDALIPVVIHQNLPGKIIHDCRQFCS